MKQNIIRSVLCLALLLFQVASGWAAEQKPLVVLSHDRPPWHFMNEQGEVVGICVDIADQVFGKMGLSVVYKNYSWARVWDNIKAGRAEAAFTTSRKEPRIPYLYYPETDMWLSEFVFFSNNKDRASGKSGSYKDIVASGKVVGIERGASYDAAFWQAFPYSDGKDIYVPDKVAHSEYNRQLKSLQNTVQGFRMLGVGRISFTLADKTEGAYYVKQLGMQEQISHYDTTLFAKGYPMPFIKKSTYPNLAEIANTFDKELQKFKKTAAYHDIFEKWIGP